MARELSANELRPVCDPSTFHFTTTEELPPLQEIIGQDRARRAIEFGIEIESPGFNIYALGPSGSGRTSIVKRFLEQKAAGRPTPDDWCYVNNFADPRRPRALHLPPGRGVRLRRDMAELVTQLRDRISRAFESEDYARHRSNIHRAFQEAQNGKLAALEEFVRQRGFTLLRTPMGLAVAPVVDGQVLDEEAYQKLPPEVRGGLEKHRSAIQEQMEKTIRAIRDLEKEARARVQELDRQVAMYAVGHLIEDVKTRYADCPQVGLYLDELQGDVVENVHLFQPSEAAEETSPKIPGVAGRGDPLTRYSVNVIVDNSKVSGAPVVFEGNPTYYNLVGRTEYRAELGALVTDFTMIRSGALHRANGGYLMLEAASLLRSPLAWDVLKRALRSGEIRLDEMSADYTPALMESLRPEPIPLDTKVVLIGDAQSYYLLLHLDEEFGELFKVKAEFDYLMDRTPEGLQNYAAFIAERCREEGLRHFTPDGVAAVVDHSSRLVEDQYKLSTRFGEITDLLREASFWAGQNKRQAVTAADVRQAVSERTRRLNRSEKRWQELMREGVILVDTEGAKVGQVNGVSVIEMGDYAFGRPSRITAITHAGEAGLVALDREAKLSGPLHDKGVFTLVGYLSAKYARGEKLSFSARLSFEQSYEEIEGDSAASTELYALLSSLADLPIRQGIAATGSVNQHGEVQAIGQVNAKIEGFFDLCAARGLTGEQGMVIPEANVRNLALREDVVEAVRAGKFHIWAVRTVDEGIALLTGCPAGERDSEGRYPEDSVNGRVENGLPALSEAARKEEGKAKGKQ
ncbi:MAG: AAA family ATPase [Chloroflexi bacterium]|nr:AAA family ATPase [Chloroflexota bacterium]